MPFRCRRRRPLDDQRAHLECSIPACGCPPSRPQPPRPRPRPRRRHRPSSAPTTITVCLFGCVVLGPRVPVKRRAPHFPATVREAWPLRPTTRSAARPSCSDATGGSRRHPRARANAAGLLGGWRACAASGSRVRSAYWLLGEVRSRARRCSKPLSVGNRMKRIQSMSEPIISVTITSRNSKTTAIRRRTSERILGPPQPLPLSNIPCADGRPLRCLEDDSTTNNERRDPRRVEESGKLSLLK